MYSSRETCFLSVVTLLSSFRHQMKFFPLVKDRLCGSENGTLASINNIVVSSKLTETLILGGLSLLIR